MTDQRLLFYSSLRSPFARKVRIALRETDLMDQVDEQIKSVALHLPTDAEVLAANPLGKLPVLIPADAEPIFDSRLICDYLDTLSPGALIPIDPAERWTHMRLQALADGTLDILLLWRTELTRPGLGSADIRAAWAPKVRAAMDSLEAHAPLLRQSDFKIAQVAVTCLLGHLDFRWPDCAWRDPFPNLAAFEAAVSGRPSVAETRVPVDLIAEGAEVTKAQLTFAP